MNKKVHYIDLDVHKETIAVAIAPEGGGEVRHYGIIGGTHDDVLRLVKKLQVAHPEAELQPQTGVEPGEL